MTPTTAAVIAGQRRGEPQLAVRALDQRPAEQDEQERRQEREAGDDASPRPRRRGTARQARTAPAPYAPTKPTNATTMISGPGVVSPSARPSIICVGVSHA